MFNRLIILALLFLASEKVNSLPFPGFLMTFSDALPVQLWPVACATYNEHEASGMYHKCFCAPWECDDVIKIQFEDTPGQIFSLVIVNADDEELGSFDIEEVESGIYEYSLNLAEDSPDVCDQQIQLQIKENTGTQGVSFPDLDEWVNDGGAGTPWTLGAVPAFSITVFGTSSETLYVDYPFIPGLEYTVTVNFSLSTTISAGSLTIRILDSSLNTLFSEVTAIDNSGLYTSDPLVFVATSDSTRIGISAAGSGANSTLTVGSVDGTRQVGETSVVAKSDCLDIRQNHEETILITYSNHRNFAGLKYEISSPEIEFFIRVPAVFYHQRFPEEDEVMELSSSLVTLNGTLRKQRQLEIDYVPYYFHEKLKLILKHQFITILDRQWVKQEGYEIVEGERRWPVKKGKVWLSEKDFVHRNIL